MVSNEHVDSSVSRRTIAKGVAWGLPAVAVAAPAPAFAISGVRNEVTITGNDTAWTTRVVTLPANAHDISYTILGGGGHSAGDHVGFPGGNGAIVTGTISLTGCTTSRQIWMAAAGRGTFDTGGQGFGDGGTPTTYSLNSYSGSWEQSTYWGGGGGGGSALGFGSAPANASVLAVAGGGGGSGNISCVNEITGDGNPSPGGTWTYGVGGSNGSNGSSTTIFWNLTNDATATAGGGAAASGAVGGAGSTVHTFNPANYGSLTRRADVEATINGITGNNFGVGGLGGKGGNGAGLDIEYVFDGRTYRLAVASGCGGGGYAGGGSGAAERWGFTTPSGTSYIQGLGGAGGSGSNYTTTVTNGCLTSTPSPTTTQGSNGAVPGTHPSQPGSVTIVWYA